MLEKLPAEIGHALQGKRAGIDKIMFHRVFKRHIGHIEVLSDAFVHMGVLPVRYTADGDGSSPPLEWRDVPTAAASMVLVVEDADSPTPHPLVHAIAVDLAGGVGSLDEGALSGPSAAQGGPGAGGAAVHVGLNSFLKRGWLAPDPPPGHGQHRYAFQVFALAEGATFSEAPGRQELIDAVAARALAAGCLSGTYERARRVASDDAVAAADTAAQAIVLETQVTSATD